MNVSVQQERLEDCIPEIMELVPLHWEEVTNHEWRPDPDWDRFVALERQGILRTVVARNEYGKLIAYFGAIVTPALHYRSKVLAWEDAFFVHPDYRHGKVGAQLFRKAIEVLKADGCHRLIVHEKINAPVEAFLARLGFKAIERNWWLDLN